MMGKFAKPDPEDVSLYDLEYRADEDDAWYNVYVLLDEHSQKLTVKYLCTPEVYEVAFSAADFETEDQVDELVTRFRPVSDQLQDAQCGKLEVGTAVCASHGTSDNDLRFYDAVVEAVRHQEHSFVGGEEVCPCTFLVYWKHGRGRDTLTSVKIENICLPECCIQIDPRLSAFAVMAKEKITSSKSISAFDNPCSASIGPSTGRNNGCISIDKKLDSSQNDLMEMETSMILKNLTPKSEDSGRISNYNSWNSQDEDLGPKPCIVDGLAADEGQHVIFINHLETDLTPSAIQKFIYKKTTILPQAFVFPRLLSEPFARGAIVVDCMRKFQIINEFLDNPDHLIVSSRGRPWVITEKAVVDTFKASIWNLIPKDMDVTQHKGTDEELEIVHLGTESYKRANQLKGLVNEFIHHESRLYKRFVLEEESILVSLQQA